MNNKILSGALIVGIASTGFAGISLADSDDTTIQKTKIEQSVKSEFGKKHFQHKGERGEKNQNKENKKVIVEALLAGETLTAEQEAIKVEMIEKISNTEKQREGSETILKILNGEQLSDTDNEFIAEMKEKQAQRETMKAIKVKLDNEEELTTEEQALVDEMKAEKEIKKLEREAQRETMKAIKDKLDNEEELTAEEQALVDEMKEKKGERHSKKGGKKGNR